MAMKPIAQVPPKKPGAGPHSGLPQPRYPLPLCRPTLVHTLQSIGTQLQDIGIVLAHSSCRGKRRQPSGRADRASLEKADAGFSKSHAKTKDYRELSFPSSLAAR